MVRNVIGMLVGFALLFAAVGTSSPWAADTSNTRERLAELQRQARFGEAIGLARQHLLTLKGTFGDRHPEIGHILNRLAELHRLKGEPARAAELYQRVLIQYAGVRGQDREIIRTALGNLTLIHMSLGQFDRAERFADLMEQEVKLAIAGTATKKQPDASQTGEAPVVAIAEPKAGRETKTAGSLSSAGLLPVPPPDGDPPPEAARTPENAGQAIQARDIASPSPPPLQPASPPAARPSSSSVAQQASRSAVQPRLLPTVKAMSEPEKTGTNPGPLLPPVDREKGTQTRTAALDTKQASPSEVPPAKQTAKPACPAPEITTAARDGGMMDVTVRSTCARGKPFALEYHGQIFKGQLDEAGTAMTTLDMFAGAASKLRISVSGGAPLSIAPPKLDLANLAKVAVIWQAPVDLDLHAQEYAAGFNSSGHIWRGSKRSMKAVRGLVRADKRAHGYLSSSSTGNGQESHVEVLTLLRGPKQKYGLVQLSLDYASRGSEPRPPFCGKGKYAEISFQVVIFDQKGRVRQEDGLIPAMPCGKKIGHRARYMKTMVPDIRLRH